MYFTPFSIVSIVDFEQVGWEVLLASWFLNEPWKYLSISKIWIIFFSFPYESVYSENLIAAAKSSRSRMKTSFLLQDLY